MLGISFFTVRLVVIALLLLVAVAVIISGLRNRKRLSFFALFIVAIPLAGFGYFEYKYQEEMTFLQETTQTLTANKEMQFNCQLLLASLVDTESGEKVIRNGENSITIKYSPCKEIREWMTSEDKGTASESQIKSLHVYSKELVRASGVTNPDEIECLAIKNNATVFHYLGATEAQAINISNYYKRNLVDTIFARDHKNCV